MTNYKIFYSWQSDLPNSTNRGFIEKALQIASKNIKNDESIKVEPVIDRDTLGIPGSPDISQTIFEKIDQSQIFVCDISIINTQQKSRPTPNPNVLLELGYAIKSLGAKRVIMTMNTAYGTPDALPFDLKLKRVIPYCLPEDTEERAKERTKLSRQLEMGLHTILAEFEGNSNTLPSNTSIEFDQEWLNSHMAIARPNLHGSKLTGYMEIYFSLSTKTNNFSHQELLHAAENAQINTFGWPIGIIMTRPDKLPKPRNDVIVSEVLMDDHIGDGIPNKIESYDYLALRKNGDLYIFKTIFEDIKSHTGKKLFFNTRIIRVTEVILYCKNLYSNLNIDPSTLVKIGIKHGDLQGRILSATTHQSFFRGTSNQCEEKEVVTNNEFSLSSIDNNIVEIVKKYCVELFALFGFQTFRDEVYSQIVNNYVQGKTQ